MIPVLRTSVFVFSIFFLATAIGCKRGPSTAEALVEKFWAAQNSGDANTLSELYIEWADWSAGLDCTPEGANALKKRIDKQRSAAFSHAKKKIDELREIKEYQPGKQKFELLFVHDVSKAQGLERRQALKGCAVRSDVFSGIVSGVIQAVIKVNGRSPGDGIDLIYGNQVYEDNTFTMSYYYKIVDGRWYLYLL